ncbi:MAG TPA: hypothetical protein VGL81_21435 [Polyangiaceae bacterium]
MLPSSKRPPRSQEPSEVIRTGDYEVVHGSPSSKRRVAAPKTSDRPRVFARSIDDEDKTLLFSNSVRSMLPPRPQTPVATPAIAKAAKTPNMAGMNLRGLTRQSERPASPESLRGSVRPRMDTEDRTILRPTSTLPPALQRMIPAPAPATPSAPPKPPSARPPAMMPTPYMPIRPMAAGPTAPPVAFNAPGGTDARKPASSDPHGDPPSAVITAKTRILRTRQSMSWAVGLMALGAMVGLVTAVVARGDADSLIDATASIVDPSHASAAHANGAVAQAAVLPSFVETSHKTTAPIGTDANPAPGACLDPGATATTVTTPVVVNAPPASRSAEVKTASLAGADPQPASRPAPPKPSPVAFAAPARFAPRPVAAAAAPREGGSSGWLANITPPNSGGPIGRPSKAGAKTAGNDFESANAADALAKAQLEASLR